MQATVSLQIPPTTHQLLCVCVCIMCVCRQRSLHGPGVQTCREIVLHKARFGLHQLQKSGPLNMVWFSNDIFFRYICAAYGVPAISCESVSCQTLVCEAPPTV